MLAKRLIQRLSPIQREALFSRLLCRANVAERTGDMAGLHRAARVLGRFSLLSGRQ